MKHIECPNCGSATFRRKRGRSETRTRAHRSYTCCSCLTVIDLSNRPAIEVADIEAGIRLTEEETDDDQDRRESD